MPRDLIKMAIIVVMSTAFATFIAYFGFYKILNDAVGFQSSIVRGTSL